MEDKLDEQYMKLESIRTNSIVLLDPNIADKEENPLHMDFQPLTDDQSKHFSRRLNTELHLRYAIPDIDDEDNERLKNVIAGSLEERRAEVKDCLEDEESTWHAKKTMDRQ